MRGEFSFRKFLNSTFSLSRDLLQNVDQKLDKISALSDKIDGLSLASTQLLLNSASQQNTTPSMCSMSVVSRQNSIGSNLADMAEEEEEKSEQALPQQDQQVQQVEQQQARPEHDQQQQEQQVHEQQQLLEQQQQSEDLQKTLQELQDLQHRHAHTLTQLGEQAGLNEQLRHALDAKAQEIHTLKESLRRAEQDLETQRTIVNLLQDEAVVLDEVTPTLTDYENQIKSLESELLRMHERGEVNFV